MNDNVENTTNTSSESENIEIVNDPLTESNSEYVPEITEMPLMTMLGTGNGDPMLLMTTLSSGNPQETSGYDPEDQHSSSSGTDWE